jgi:4-amino-4-deoxy-L-arabinose transferase-like glycosyltransferase
VSQKGNYSKILAIILIIAAALRFWHISAIYPLPLFDELTIDSKKYDEWATFIANGNWLGGDKAFYMDPLYSYVLAIQYKIFGHNLLFVRLVQVTFGVVFCFLIAQIGRRIGGDRVGLVSALLAALYQPLIFESTEIEKTALGMLLTTASLACAIRKSKTAWFASGAFLALASLCRANLLIFGPLGVLSAFMLQEIPGHSETGESKAWLNIPHLSLSASMHAVAFIAGFLCLLSPVVLRNHYVSGEWVLTTSQSGPNFYTGNNPSNITGIFTTVPFVRPLPEFEEHDFHNKAEELAGKALTSREVSSFWFSQAWEHIVNHPQFALTVFMRKAILFWSDVEVSDGWSFYFLKKYSPALKLPLFTFGWIFPFALIGVAVTIGKNREARLMLVFVLTYSASVIVFFVFSRYRIYVVPPLFIFASLGIIWLYNKFKEQNWRPFAFGCFVVVVAVLFSFFGTNSFINKSDMYLYDYTVLSEMYAKRGDFESAGTLLQEALQIQPDSVEVHYEMGKQLLAANNLDEAANHFRRCLSGNPEHTGAWRFLQLVCNKQSVSDIEMKSCIEGQ